MLHLTAPLLMGGLMWILGSGALLLGILLLIKKTSIIFHWTILLSGSSNLEMLLLLDFTSLLFLGSVGMVAGSVFIFSRGYMSGEKFFWRFHGLVLLFVFSMATLILSPNLISLLLGWDGLGVTSFLLVIYFQSAKSYNAGMLTVLTNRGGDLAILLAISVAALRGDWGIFTQSVNTGENLFFILGALIILAAMTKSAQIPFSAWLPAAMAAPTPVSSLVHSSTLVTAGIYILIRLSDSLVQIGMSCAILTLGAATMFMAGMSALYEPDMKKIVALSTLSQLGLMMSALGLNMWLLAFIHLLAHAYFKALLFMCVGNMIHMADDFQDMRKGSLSIYSALSLSFSGIANFSLCGFPFLSGFYSKDWILEWALNSQLTSGALILFFIATLLTAAYSLRFTLLCWLATSRKNVFSWESDTDFSSKWAYSALSPLAVLGGGFLLSHAQAPLIPVLSLGAKVVTPLIIISGFFLIFGASNKFYYLTPKFGAWSTGLMWSLPTISSKWALKPALILAKKSRSLDFSWIAISLMASTMGQSMFVIGEPLASRNIKYMAFLLSVVLFMIFLFSYLVSLSRVAGT